MTLDEVRHMSGLHGLNSLHKLLFADCRRRDTEVAPNAIATKNGRQMTNFLTSGLSSSALPYPKNSMKKARDKSVESIRLNESLFLRLRFPLQVPTVPSI